MAHPFGLGLQTFVVGGTCLALGKAAEALGYPLFQDFYYGIAGIAVAAAGLTLARQWRRSRTVGKMLRPTGTYGKARLASQKDAIEFGLGGKIDGKGIFLGAIGKTPLIYRGLSHVVSVAPNAAGKTASITMPNAMSIGWNLVCTDKGGEVAARTWKHRRDVLNQTVVVINPWNLFAALGLPNHHFNPVGHLPALVGSPELVDAARAVASILIPDPPTRGENQFFRDAAKDLLTWLLIYLAHLEADTGELACNLCYLYNLVCGSKEDLDECLAAMVRAEDYGNGAVTKAGGRIKARAERNAKTFESILAEVQNGLALFDPLGPLGKTTEYSDFDPADLKNKPMSIFIAAPPEKLNGPYGTWAGLVVDSLIRTVMQARTLHPRVTFLLDEFANLSTGALPSITPALYVGRSYGCQLHLLVQDRTSFKRYPEPSAFETQMEVMQFWGVRSIDDAKWLEERAGITSIITESGSLPVTEGRAVADGKYSMSLSEKGVPVVSKGNALQLPDYKQLIIFKNQPVILADLISYRMIDPLLTQAASLPGDENEPDLPIRFTLP
ncbi:type IV secretory system conjugative DNA transfer family protein [Rhizobium sp. RU36D]|uniref:type IV secretory system conjugative DNA transfer family protein n=1 Tax=Rhizobium sp. RU36D TaxID=1907415 RepID=UPI0009D7F682|nr:type IV secretory system conjugative DNA transfer family protein [Rhizobium sp. RU36D]SMD14971.1 Type IV secretory pathway, VirD4 component, TraG/TraD family ATPase [Rhizobium sp. RU36D]